MLSRGQRMRKNIFVTNTAAPDEPSTTTRDPKPRSMAREVRTPKVSNRLSTGVQELRNLNANLPTAPAQYEILNKERDIYREECRKNTIAWFL